MKSMKLMLALATLTASVIGCSHKPARSDREQTRAATSMPATTTTPVQQTDATTVSGSTTSLGASTSGRGH